MSQELYVVFERRDTSSDALCLVLQEAARALNKPLHVVHLLVPDLAFKPTKRHFSFFLEAAREVEQELKQLNIGFDMPFVTSKDPKGKIQNALEKIEEVFTNLQPALAITDFNPLRYESAKGYGVSRRAV